MDTVIFATLLFCTCGLAALVGGPPERIAAALLTIAAVASDLLGANYRGFKQVDWNVFLIDCMLLIAMFALAMRANRYWPLWITSFQLLTVFSHLAVAILGVRKPLAYAVMSTIWSYPIQCILAAGAIRSRLRKRQLNADRPWNGY